MLDLLTDPVGQALGAVLVALLGAITALINKGLNKFSEKTEIEVSKEFRETLHSALYSGVLFALDTASEVTPAPVDDLIEKAIAYARRSSPNTMARAEKEAGTGLVRDLARAKMREQRQKDAETALKKILASADIKN